ncbi:hypothetical protein U6G28_07385 [Actinomycetaceae bacterium MB13-C1-2]|nr:hypothetical protein U6G28_07385 [Actinomycetaceae bacterium MB13-C1-2]
MTTDSQHFAQLQANAARLKRQMLLDAQEAESAKAAEFLHQFVQSAAEKGLMPEPLFARGYGGKGRAKTPLKGWYLKNDHSLAVDTEGNYYILTADLSVLDRLRGIRPQPSPPPLVLSQGGRDGESMDLTVKLSEILPTWRRGEGC